MSDQRSLFIIAILFLISFHTSAQSFDDRYEDLSAKNDTSAQAALLKEWEQASPNDAGLFIAYFNFYAGKSMQEFISIDKNEKDEHSFALNDTGTGNTIAYLNSSLKYDPGILQKGFDYIERGISLYPARLDMRFGRIYMLGQAEDYAAFTKAIIETIDYGNTISNAWKWKEDRPVDDARQFFLDAMQEYITTIYNTGNDSLLSYMRQISETVLKYNPNHVESLADIALTYLITGEYDRALSYLLQAEAIAPKDVIVLNNIAEAYKRKKDIPNARIYYQKVMRYGDKETGADAKLKLKDLE